jgi:hypothetical protein
MDENAHLSIDNSLANHRLVVLVLLSSNFALPSLKEGRSEHTIATRPLSSPENIWKLSAIRASFNHPLLVLALVENSVRRAQLKNDWLPYATPD